MPQHMCGDREKTQGKDGSREQDSENRKPQGVMRISTFKLPDSCHPQGSKIRSTYITFAKNERSRLEKRVQELTKELETKKDQVEAARGTKQGGCVTD
jgi:hypothetical protein